MAWLDRRVLQLLTEAAVLGFHDIMMVKERLFALLTCT